MKVYISGPITDTPDHREKFAEAERVVRSFGDVPVSPLAVLACISEDCAGPRPADYLERIQKDDAPKYVHAYHCYMKYDILAMLQCDAIFMISGWERSPGARIEHFVALTCGLEIY